MKLVSLLMTLFFAATIFAGEGRPYRYDSNLDSARKLNEYSRDYNVYEPSNSYGQGQQRQSTQRTYDKYNDPIYNPRPNIRELETNDWRR